MIGASWRSATLALALGTALAACKQEKRDFRPIPPGATAFPAVRVSGIQAGPSTVDPSLGAYQESRWAVSRGQQWYSAFNCAGCHAPGGGGGMGPALNDSEWIYGSEPENVFASIVEGRPNGMPSWRGRLTNAQVWQLVAFVRSLDGLTPKSTWSPRTDHMAESHPEREAKPRVVP